MKELQNFDMDFEDKKEKEISGEHEYCDICQLLFHVDDLVIPDMDNPNVKLCTNCLRGTS